VRDGYAVDLGGPAAHPYRDAEAEAREAKRGIWRGSFELPAEWRAANPQNGR
jgi:endonuclease YncB( thermonuclease family)